MPTKIRMYSPTVTAGGGETGKKNSAWSAGAVRKRSTASITAKMPASLGLRSHSEIKPAIGSNNPTVMKKPANAKVRITCIRVSNPNGVNRKPKIKPNPNKTANIFSAFVRGLRAGCFFFPPCPCSGRGFVD